MVDPFWNGIAQDHVSALDVFMPELSLQYFISGLIFAGSRNLAVAPHFENLCACNLRRDLRI